MVTTTDNSIRRVIRTSSGHSSSQSSRSGSRAPQNRANTGFPNYSPVNYQLTGVVYPYPAQYPEYVYPNNVSPSPVPKYAYPSEPPTPGSYNVTAQTGHAPDAYWTHPPPNGWQMPAGGRYVTPAPVYGQAQAMPYGDGHEAGQIYDEDGNAIYPGVPMMSNYPYMPPPAPPYIYNPGPPPMSPISPVFTGSPVEYQPPQRAFSPVPPQPQASRPPYTPTQALPELARGHLARANLHHAAYGRPQPIAHQYPEQQHRHRQQSGLRNALPNPPPHSEWAMWVGNIPNDASHPELWRFFNSRPSPASGGFEHDDDVDPETAPDLHWTGVQSIHLIARSNCCFVNYASRAHLQQALATCTGITLRPNDPRSKPLVCRVRRKSDDTKTGVGAQRGQRIHHQWVAEHAQEVEQEQRRQSESTEPRTPPATSEAPSTWTRATPQTVYSTASTTSTSSSFLTKHFAKRFFVLKSHTKEDLDISVRTGIWATQSHNEPVLDQAFRTSKEAVYLFFSANKMGEFYGVARMEGPVFRAASHSSTISNGSLLRKTMTIEEGKPFAAPSSLLSPSHQGVARYAPILTPNDIFASPLPATPYQSLDEATTPTDPKAASFIFEAQIRLRRHMAATDPTPMLRIGQPGASIAERRGATLDVDFLANAKGGLRDLSVSIPDSTRPVDVRRPIFANPVPDSDGIVRRDTLLSPPTQNAYLEELEPEGEQQAPQQAAQGKKVSTGSVDKGWGKPFRIQWLSTEAVSFQQTRSIKNKFNQDRPVQISRDGTEVDPIAGDALLALFLGPKVKDTPREIGEPV